MYFSNILLCSKFGKASSVEIFKKYLWVVVFVMKGCDTVEFTTCNFQRNSGGTDSFPDIVEANTY